MRPQPEQRVLEGHRLADAEALHMATAQLCQHGVFTDRFDAFGQRFEVQPFGHGQDRRDHPLLFAILVHVQHKGAVDFQTGDREASDIGDRGMTGAEIIQIDATSQIGERRDVAG